MSRLLLLFHLLLIFVFSDCEHDSCISIGDDEYQIYPGITCDMPDIRMEVIYRKFYKKIKADCGNELHPSETKFAPTVEFEAEGSEYYSLFMIDPDAPTPQNPTSAEFLHWHVYNIPGAKVNEGQISSPYVRPAPPEYSDAHRYIFLAFRQLRPFNDGEVIELPRKNFCLLSYAAEMDLGLPVAGNFFRLSSK